MKKNTIQCLVCKSKNVRYYFKAKRTSYFKCNDCELIFAVTLPRSTYENYDLSHYLKLEPYLKNAFHKQVKTIKKYKPRGKVLEIGSGMGYMMELLEDASFSVKGIEPADSLVKYSRKKKLDVTKGYFEKIKMDPSSFDVVVINHVLEHIKDPVNFLEKIKRVLKPGGILFLQVPNIGSYEARIMKEKWSYVVPEDHYLQFTHNTMNMVLKKAGFSVIEAKTTGLSNELDDIFQELVRCLRNDKKRFIYYLIKFIPSLFENSFNQGSALWYIAR